LSISLIHTHLIDNSLIFPHAPTDHPLGASTSSIMTARQSSRSFFQANCIDWDHFHYSAADCYLDFVCDCYFDATPKWSEFHKTEVRNGNS
jgi:hypothetical protein